MRLNSWVNVTGVLLALFTLNASAVEGQAGLDVSLSDETGRFGLYSTRESEIELTTLQVDYFFNQINDSFVGLNGSVMRKGVGGNKNLELGVKGQAFYLSRGQKVTNAKTGMGLMLGGSARYWLPAEMPVAIAGDFLYSPRIVTLGDAVFALESNIRAEVRILPSAMAYIGFRQLSAEFSGLNYELDKNIHIGIRVALQ